MSKILEDWYRRKLNDENNKLVKTHTITEVYLKQSCVSQYGKITLSVSPSNIFQFESKVDWSKKNGDDIFEISIIDGLIDEIMSSMSQKRILLGIKIVLEDVDVHPIGSSQLAFYMVARNAMRKVISNA